MKQWMSSLLYCLLCLLGILLSSFLLSKILDEWTYRIVLKTALFTVSGISLFLCLWFKQEKPFFLLFLTMIAYLLIDYFATHQYDNNYYTLVAYPLMCILYPINLCLLTSVKVNDLFLKSFVRKVIILAIETFCIYFLTYFLPSLLGDRLNLIFQMNVSKVLNYSFGLFPSKLVMPPISFLIFVGYFTICVWRFKKAMDYIHTAFLCVFILTFISFYFIYDTMLPTTLFLSATGCVLLALLQTSHTMAFLDELTNIPGRRALMSTLQQLENQNYTFAMIDIDFFKRLNDSYGHEVGDQGLRMISARLTQNAHAGHLFRYGGEEFVLLYPHKRLEEVLDEIEETRELISTSDFLLRPKKRTHLGNLEKYPYMASIKITLSVGVSEKTDNETGEDVMNIADQALYKAKQTGRNKTVYNKNGKFYELF